MTRRIVDLTIPIHENMIRYPSAWHPSVQVKLLGTHEVANRETRSVVLGTHTGTHCDAPRHFIPGGESVNNLELNILIGSALVLNFSSIDPGTEVNVTDIQQQLFDRKPERLVMRFDWSENLDKENYYTEHPFISEEAAKWLVNNGVRLLAIDTPTPDNPINCKGADCDSPNHKIFLRSGVILVEYLTNLKELRRDEVELIVLPLKIEGGDGSPARCVAIES